MIAFLFYTSGRDGTSGTSGIALASLSAGALFSGRAFTSGISGVSATESEVEVRDPVLVAKVSEEAVYAYDSVSVDNFSVVDVKDPSEFDRDSLVDSTTLASLGF